MSTRRMHHEGTLDAHRRRGAAVGCAGGGGGARLAEWSLGYALTARGASAHGGGTGPLGAGGYRRVPGVAGALCPSARADHQHRGRLPLRRAVGHDIVHGGAGAGHCGCHGARTTLRPATDRAPGLTAGPGALGPLPGAARFSGPVLDLPSSLPAGRYHRLCRRAVAAAPVAVAAPGNGRAPAGRGGGRAAGRRRWDA